MTPTTAASSENRNHLFSAATNLIDPHSGKPLQSRKKVEYRVEKDLESRGSVITGRDEYAIL
jgi:hypothetical protein